MEQKRKAVKLLPYPVIASATLGEADAINIILAHYKGYIAKLCIRPIVDGAGVKHMRVDPDMQSRLETALIKKILEFRIA